MDMTDHPLISVIVPVYGVEKYLDRCVQSIVDQTYKNLEIILVDDGSPDNCGAMCDAWAEKDSRIQVIHKENGGLSDARNAGMAIASGELLTFVDSDDWILPEMYEHMIAKMKEDDSDVCSCGMLLFWESGRPDQMLTLPGNMVLDTKAALQAVIEESWVKQPVCNKIYKAAIAASVAFPLGKCNEDNFWTYQVIARATRISVMEDPFYRYLQRESSIMGSTYSLKRLDYIEAKKQLISYLKTNHPELVSVAAAELLLSCIYSMQMSMQFLCGEEQKEAFRIIRQTAEEVSPVGLNKSYGLKKNIWLILAQFSLEGVCRLQLFLEKKGKKSL